MQSADVAEKKNRLEEEKTFVASLGKEPAHVKKILGHTMATGQRWKGTPHPMPAPPYNPLLSTGDVM